MKRLLICGGIAMSLLLWGLWQKSQRLELAAQLEQERKEWAQAKSSARQQAIDALQAMQRVYEKRLRQQAKARAAIEQERTKVITQIEEGKENGPQDYRRWAVQPLPDVVIDRLRQLPQKRTAAGHHSLSDTTP